MIFKQLEEVTIKKNFQYLVMRKNMQTSVAKVGNNNTLCDTEGFFSHDQVKFILTLDRKFYDKCFFTTENEPRNKTKIIGYRKNGIFSLFYFTSGRFYCSLINNFVKKSEVSKWANIPESKLIKEIEVNL